MKILILFFSLLGSGFIYADSLEDYLSEDELVLEEYLSEAEPVAEELDAKEKVTTENQENYYDNTVVVDQNICNDLYMSRANCAKFLKAEPNLFLIYE